MVRTEDVIAFFDRLAPMWDADMVRNESVIGTILDNAGVAAGKTVLDVACGTGVLIPDYLSRGVASVTGIDVSPRMAEIARAKFEGERVHIVCGDAERCTFDRRFDCIVVYNAFPHFADPERLIRTLSEALAPGGTLSIAHGMSREKLNAHHHGTPESVSCGLMPIETLSEIMRKYLRITAAVSDDRMYQVCGTRIK
jgi:demethylmenaquinone methyltransferase/2-methoxy-6-polyprenyl-1,4-benzoquinol methylase